MATVDCQFDRVTRELSLWACLWLVILIMFIEVGRSAHCGQRHSLPGILDCSGKVGGAVITLRFLIKLPPP